jgi:hypothetical protein
MYPRNRCVINFNDKIILERILLHKNNYNAIYRDSLKYKFFLESDHIDIDKNTIEVLNNENGTISEHKIIPIGYHKKNKFIWNINTRDIIEDHIYQTDFPINIISTRLRSKIFSKKCRFTKIKYKNIIPYLVSITNPLFNVIHFDNDEKCIRYYFLISKEPIFICYPSY